MTSRLYINITNACTTNCPFCCMYSGREKKTFMSFDIFKSIIGSHQNIFDLQLEGGEPFLHEDLYKFIEYAAGSGHIKSLTILTNGTLLGNKLEKLIAYHEKFKIPIVIKSSVNYWLLKENPGLLKKLASHLKYLEPFPQVSLILNVRLREKDKFISDALIQSRLDKISNISPFHSYGKLKDNTAYEKPTVYNGDGTIFNYACDGTNFGEDYIARTEYEKILT